MKLIRTNSEHPDFQALIKLLDQDLAIRDGEDHAFYQQFNKLDKINYVVVGFLGDRAIGCGALRAYSSDVVEIKRMFMLAEYRGRGFAGLVLSELESWSIEMGFKCSILETGHMQPEAIRLYKKSSYAIIPNYGQYKGVANSVCMEKNLG